MYMYNLNAWVFRNWNLEHEFEYKLKTRSINQLSVIIRKNKSKFLINKNSK